MNQNVIIHEENVEPMPTVGDDVPKDDRRSRSPSSRSGSHSRSRSRSRDVRDRRSRYAAGSSRGTGNERRRRSPSRSRSRDRDRDRRRRHRSLSYSRSPQRRSSKRVSRSPPPRRGGGGGSNRDRERGQNRVSGSQDQVEPSRVLGVFGLSLRTRERDLEDIMEKYGELNRVTIVYDHRSNRSRGFGFVYFKNQDEATLARNKTNGLEIDGRQIRVDYSMTQRPHTPTPGEYMGDKRRDRYRGGERRRSRSRSRSRERTVRGRRSRSRSYS